MTDDADGADDSTCKVARLLEAYEFDGLGAELEARWTSDDRNGMSLRELETYFNERLLESQMRSVGLQSLEGEVANFYRLLTDDDVSGAERTRVTRRLERAGVDVEQLRADFVSYQSIRTYLRECRDATYSHEDNAPKESALRLITQMQNRTDAITRNKLDQLSQRDDFQIEEPQVYVDVRVVCGGCSSQYQIGELLEGRGCSCQSDAET